jgi:hypothetical protein
MIIDFDDGNKIIDQLVLKVNLHDRLIAQTRKELVAAALAGLNCQEKELTPIDKYKIALEVIEAESRANPGNDYDVIFDFIKSKVKGEK